MPLEILIKEIKEYCRVHFPNVKKVEAKNFHLNTNNLGAIENITTRIVLNDKIEFDYVGGTSVSNYNSYYKKA